MWIIKTRAILILMFPAVNIYTDSSGLQQKGVTNVCERFERTSCLHHHGRRSRTQSETYETTYETAQCHDAKDSNVYTGPTYRVIQNDCRGVNNLSHTIHLVLQMQPHVISFYGVTSRIRFMFLLFPQVSRNWRLLHATNSSNELDYRVEVCRITKGAHIEHL